MAVRITARSPQPLSRASRSQSNVSGPSLASGRRRSAPAGRLGRCWGGEYKIASKAEWVNFAGLKQTFGAADQVGNCVVFDVGSNRYRLIGRVLYPHKLSVLRVMDHEEYDRAPWASQCGCHSPPPKSLERGGFQSASSPTLRCGPGRRCESSGASCRE
ncbi:MAG: type II toxin-antitoxin system HigB family toxin [Planctomycetota bacterium]|nr:MAG: type II toxin-antitoxin system HigB family toxin [Planctomycetota bacterium]